MVTVIKWWGLWGWGSWVLLEFSGLSSLCCAVGVAGMRLAPVCGVAWVATVWEVASMGWSAIMPFDIMAWGVMGAKSFSGDWKRSMRYALLNYSSVLVGMGADAWPCLALMSVTRKRVWSVTLVVGVLMPWMRLLMDRLRNLEGAILGKMAKFITAITLDMRAVVAKMTYLYTNKTSIITGYHTDCRRF